MVELFAEQNALKDTGAAAEKDCSSRCFEEAFAVPKQQAKTEAAAADTPIKDVPGASLGADGFLKYHGLHLPTWAAKNPDGSATKPFMDDNGKERVNGKLQPVSDYRGFVLGQDGQPVLDARGLRRYDSNGNLVVNKLEASDPGEMQKRLEQSKDPLNDQSRAEYNKMIESADKLDRVELARAMAENEKYVSAHTTAFLFETGYQQAQKALAELSAELLKNPSQEKLNEVLAKKAEITVKDEELKQKPVMHDQVGRVREGNASDELNGRLLTSSLDSRSAYLNKLLQQDSVKKYVASKDMALETDTNLNEARKMVKELMNLNPGMAVQLKDTATKLGIDSGNKARK